VRFWWRQESAIVDRSESDLYYPLPWAVPPIRLHIFFGIACTEKLMVYAWVNDETTLRAYGSKTDAYAAFKRMLEKKRPPDDWDALKKESMASQQRLAAVAKITKP
jgi:hypothetical protein